MDLEILKQANRGLTKCGARPPMRGNLWVPFPCKSFLVPMTVTAGQVATFPLEIPGETPWELCAISSDQGMATTSGASQTTNVRIQIQLASGRYLFGGNGVDVSQLAWVGSWRFLVDPPEEFQPGDKLLVTLTDYGVTNSPFSMNLVFEGAYKYFLEGHGMTGGNKSALSIPRYQGIIDENILAAPWMAGVGPQIPPGARDDYFVYSSPANVDSVTEIPTGTPIPLAGPVATTIRIAIDSTTDFICRRLLFDLEADATVTAGTCLGRLRTGDGFSLNDNFIDLARYLNGVEFPLGWKIRGGDSVFVDLVLADTAGTGNKYMQVHLEGAKRRYA